MHTLYVVVTVITIALTAGITGADFARAFVLANSAEVGPVAVVAARSGNTEGRGSRRAATGPARHSGAGDPGRGRARLVLHRGPCSA